MSNKESASCASRNRDALCIDYGHVYTDSPECDECGAVMSAQRNAPCANRYLLWQGNAAVVDIDTSGDMCAADVLEHVAYWLREEPRNDYRLEILPSGEPRSCAAARIGREE